ncbi:MAG: aspartate carbamoyltransferase [Armatimonadota bacterium]
MSLKGKSLISLSDFSQQDILDLLDLAEKMAEAIGFDGQASRAPVEPLDCILATLFYEPSTRTRLSFESAMLRLGGQVLGFADANTSSATKGETLADTARMISGYADVIVIRHPLAGSAKVISEYATVPVINAGDGAREHPTQTLTDLFCIRRELGTLSGLKVGLAGDLKYGRTVHSLAPAMAELGSDIVCVSPEQLRMPTEVLNKVRAAGQQVTEVSDLETAIAELDVLYMTRIQRERFPSQEAYDAVKGACNLTPQIMARAKEGMRVLHPLPRVDEIDTGVDGDRRAAYFRQAAGGVPVRMALMALLLGVPCTHNKQTRQGAGFGQSYGPSEPDEVEIVTEKTVPGPRCNNAKCITSVEGQLEPRYYERGGGLVCAYCEMATGG